MSSTSSLVPYSSGNNKPASNNAIQSVPTPKNSAVVHEKQKKPEFVTHNGILVPNPNLNKRRVANTSKVSQQQIQQQNQYATYALENSAYRCVFKTNEILKSEFVKYLKNIFLQLDETKVLAMMDEILQNPEKTDEEIYKEILTKIHSTKRYFSFFHRAVSFFLLTSRLSAQVSKLMQIFNNKKIQNSLEIKNNQPLGDEIPGNGQHKVTCYEGLHHASKTNISAIVDSIAKKLQIGGVFLLLEHNIAEKTINNARLHSKDMDRLVSVIHSFENAIDGVPYEDEKKEQRNFYSTDQWTLYLKNHSFTRIDKGQLVIKNDPSDNTLMAFVKTPKDLAELKETLSFRNDYVRSKIETCSNFIVGGNARFHKNYVEHIQDKHAYAFNYIGHLRQHYTHFYHFVKECLNDKDIKKTDLIFSQGMAMNLFILALTTAQCTLDAVTSLPSALIAKWKHGDKWKTVANLSSLEKFMAQHEKDYSSFIQKAPFYQYDHIGTIKKIWNVVWNSTESLSVKLSSYFNASLFTISLLAKAGISISSRLLANDKPATAKIIIEYGEGDTEEKMQTLIESWNNKHPDQPVEILISTLDKKHSVLSLPRSESCKFFYRALMNETQATIIEANGQKEFYVEVLGKPKKKLEFFNEVYSTERLDNSKGSSHHITYRFETIAYSHFNSYVRKKPLTIR